MNWKKWVNQEQIIHVLTLVVIGFCIIGIWLVSIHFLFIGFLYTLFLFLHFLYTKFSGENLVLVNEKNRQRYFIGDEGKIVLKFRNNGMSIMNAELKVYVNDKIRPIGNVITEPYTESQYVTIPFSIKYGQDTQVTVPFQCTKRGIGRVEKMEIIYPNLFGFSQIYLIYDKNWREEYLIYPEFLSTNVIPLFNQKNQGQQTFPFSLFEDRLLPVGTRDYQLTDSFQTIHWKASAKLSRLQTKVYEKIDNKSILFLMNVMDERWWNADIEKMISHIAYLAHEAFKQNIPFGIAANIRMFSNFPFLYIPVGEGKIHFEKVLETLAIIDNRALMMPYESVLQSIIHLRLNQPFIVHTGDLKEQHTNLLAKLKHSGSYVYQLQVTESATSVVAM